MQSAQPITTSERTLFVVHDMNQPLAAIRTNAETALLWLTRSPTDLGEVKRAIRRIIGNSYRAAEVYKSAGDLEPSVPLIPADIDVHRVIKRLLNLTSLDLLRQGIVTETVFAPGSHVMRGNRAQVERVIANLVTNSIEAMRTVEDRPRKLSIVTKLDPHGDLLIEVADSGSGILPEMIDRIFEPTVTTKAKGMGLGLSICRSIVEAHGGHLCVKPNLPHGSVFSFTMPLQAT